MGLEIDGAAVLAAISKSPQAFAMSEGQINTLALTTVLGRLKDKAVGVRELQSLAGALAKEDFLLILDNVASRELGTLAKRLDPKNAAIKTADDTERRSHIAGLAFGTIAPSAAAPKAPRKKAESTGSKTGRALQSKALRARRPKTV